VDGAFLFLSGEPAVRRACVDRVADLGVSHVVLSERSHREESLSVSSDNVSGARLLTEHLIGNGHDRIAFVAAKTPWPMIEQRLAGYRQALAAAGLPHGPDFEVFAGGWEVRVGETAATALLAREDAPTAIVAGNDVLALGVIRAVRRRGATVPGDVAVAGFDDFDFAEAVDPPLTTLRIPGHEMGRRAARMLLGSLGGRDPGERHVELPAELRLRQSA
jgi:DNA-binding LacI/PurR family transcriptional regulator